MMAKDASEVQIATTIGALTQKMKREMNVEDNERRRITDLNVQQFEQHEEVAVQAALAQASLIAQETILRDRQLVQDHASRSEQQTVIKLREEASAYAESQRDEVMKVKSHEVSLAAQLKIANDNLYCMHNENSELRTEKSVAIEFSEARELQYQEYLQQQRMEFQQQLTSAPMNVVPGVVVAQVQHHHGYLRGEMETEAGKSQDVSEKPTSSSNSYVVAESPSGTAAQHFCPGDSGSDSQHYHLLHERQLLREEVIDLKDEMDECQRIAYAYQ